MVALAASDTARKGWLTSWIDEVTVRCQRYPHESVGPDVQLLS